MAQRQFRTDDTDLWVDRYGQGSDGALTVSGNVTDSPTDAACTGTNGTTSLSATNASFASGQLILIHQTRGTGAGQWELNKIASYSTGTITTSYTLIQDYSSGAQVLVLPQYTAVTINGGVTLTAKAWNGSVGGIVAWLCSGITTITGNIDATGKGYRGGQNVATGGAVFQGEGTSGAGGQSTAANGNGAGGGTARGAGGSGGNGGAGTTGGNGNAGGTHGDAGGTAGSASLVTMVPGGGGGAGGNSSIGVSELRGGPGGNGGGIVFIISDTLSITGNITARGNNGGNNVGSDGAGGGAGAGGSILIKGKIVSLGTGLLATGASTGGAADGGGATGAAPGGTGRIHCDYSQTLSGTTNPTVDSVQDVIFDDLPLEQNYTLLM